LGLAQGDFGKWIAAIVLERLIHSTQPALGRAAQQRTVGERVVAFGRQHLPKLMNEQAGVLAWHKQVLLSHQLHLYGNGSTKENGAIFVENRRTPMNAAVPMAVIRRRRLGPNRPLIKPASDI
jgi:hypothetical protein